MKARFEKVVTILRNAPKCTELPILLQEPLRGKFPERSLGSYRKCSGGWDDPKETTFQRLLANLDAPAFERILIGCEIQCVGGVESTTDDQVAIDDKDQRGRLPHAMKKFNNRLAFATITAN